MKIRIVLVEPREAGNLGAAARAMKNFGLRDLWVVGPGRERVDAISEWWAAGATDLIESATRTLDLAEALADCHLTVATTAVRGRQVFEQLTPSGVARLAEEHLGENDRIAIVFGRETFGLSGSEIALCQRTAVIPTSEDFPTMNLGVSVAIFCYELAKGLRPSAPVREPAVSQLTQRLNTEARELMLEVDFFGDRNPDRMCAELQAIAARAMLTTREASLLLALVRKLRAPASSS